MDTWKSGPADNRIGCMYEIFLNENYPEEKIKVEVLVPRSFYTKAQKASFDTYINDKLTKEEIVNSENSLFVEMKCQQVYTTEKHITYCFCQSISDSTRMFVRSLEHTISKESITTEWRTIDKLILRMNFLGEEGKLLPSEEQLQKHYDKKLNPPLPDIETLNKKKSLLKERLSRILKV